MSLILLNSTCISLLILTLKTILSSCLSSSDSKKLQSIPDNDSFSPRPLERTLGRADSNSSSNAEVEGEGEGEGWESEAVRAVPIGESYSLLDWGEETPAPPPPLTKSDPGPSPLDTPTPIPNPAPVKVSANTPVTVSPSSSLTLKLPSEQLALMDAGKFQTLWKSLPDLFTGLLPNNILPDSLNFNENRIRLITIPDIEAAMHQSRIMVMASGNHSDNTSQNDGFKFFLYGIEQDNFLTGVDGAIYLAQLIFVPSSKNCPPSVTTTIKSNSGTKSSGSFQPEFGDLILKSLSHAVSSLLP